MTANHETKRIGTLGDQSSPETYGGGALYQRTDGTFFLEYRVECAVERKMDAIDRAFMDGRIATQEEYDARVKALRDWAEAEMCAARVVKGGAANA